MILISCNRLFILLTPYSMNHFLDYRDVVCLIQVLLIFGNFNKLQSSICTSDTMLSDKEIMGLQRSGNTK